MRANYPRSIRDGSLLGYLAALLSGAIGAAAFEGGADSRAETRIDIGPVLDCALQHVGLHAVLQMPNNVRDQVLAIGFRQHLAIKRAGLPEVLQYGSGPKSLFCAR